MLSCSLAKNVLKKMTKEQTKSCHDVVHSGDTVYGGGCTDSVFILKVLHEVPNWNCIVGIYWYALLDGKIKSLGTMQFHCKYNRIKIN